MDILTEKSDYKSTNNAFKTLGFSSNEMLTIWSVVAAILHLGNIEFQSKFESLCEHLRLCSTTLKYFYIFNFSIVIEDELIISPPEHLNLAAKMLQVTEEQLSVALTKRVIAAGGSIMEKAHNASQAEFGRDALTKAIYDRFFTWVISRINRAILFRGSKTQARFNAVIGVLDIYGFEIFDSNSFEQFCINYCNEKLQQLFIGM